MERLTGWKRVLLIIVAVYVVIALPLVVLDQLHILSLNNILHELQSPSFHFNGTLQITDLPIVSSGDPLQQVVQVSGKHYGLIYLTGTVDNVSQRDNRTYLSFTTKDGKTLKDALPITQNALITIFTVKNNKTTSQNNVQPNQIVKGDVISVTVQVDSATHNATITKLGVFR